MEFLKLFLLILALLSSEIAQSPREISSKEQASIDFLKSNPETFALADLYTKATTNWGDDPDFFHAEIQNKRTGADFGQAGDFPSLNDEISSREKLLTLQETVVQQLNELEKTSALSQEMQRHIKNLTDIVTQQNRSNQRVIQARTINAVVNFPTQSASQGLRIAGTDALTYLTDNIADINKDPKLKDLLSNLNNPIHGQPLRLTEEMNKIIAKDEEDFRKKYAKEKEKGEIPEILGLLSPNRKLPKIKAMLLALQADQNATTLRTNLLTKLAQQQSLEAASAPAAIPAEETPRPSTPEEAPTSIRAGAGGEDSPSPDSLSPTEKTTPTSGPRQPKRLISEAEALEISRALIPRTGDSPAGEGGATLSHYLETTLNLLKRAKAQGLQSEDFDHLRSFHNEVSDNRNNFTRAMQQIDLDQENDPSRFTKEWLEKVEQLKNFAKQPQEELEQSQADARATLVVRFPDEADLYGFTATPEERERVQTRFGVSFMPESAPNPQRSTQEDAAPLKQEPAMTAEAKHQQGFNRKWLTTSGNPTALTKSFQEMLFKKTLRQLLKERESYDTQNPDDADDSAVINEKMNRLTLLTRFPVQAAEHGLEATDRDWGFWRLDRPGTAPKAASSATTEAEASAKTVQPKATALAAKAKISFRQSLMNIRPRAAYAAIHPKDLPDASRRSEASSHSEAAQKLVKNRSALPLGLPIAGPLRAKFLSPTVDNSASTAFQDRIRAANIGFRNTRRKIALPPRIPAPTPPSLPPPPLTQRPASMQYKNGEIEMERNPMFYERPSPATVLPSDPVPPRSPVGSTDSEKSIASEDESTDATANLDDQKPPRKTYRLSDVAFTRKTPQRGKHLESEGEISTDNPAAEQPSGRPRAATNPKKPTTAPSKSFLDSLKFWEKKSPAAAPPVRSFEAKRTLTPAVNPVMQASETAKARNKRLEAYKAKNPHIQAAKVARLNKP